MERILRLQESARVRPDRPTDDRPNRSVIVRQESEDGSERSPAPSQAGEGIGNKQLSDRIGVPVSTIEKWKRAIARRESIEFRRYPNFLREWSIGDDGRWYQRETEQ